MVVLDTLVAVFAGLIIFPAVFAFGVDPAEGPQLVFVVLPAIFEQMSFAWFSGILFFGLLCVAAVTSTISLMEVAVAFLTEATEKTKHPLNRHKSVLVISAIVLVMVAFNGISLTNDGTWLCWEGKNFFDWSDMLSANIFMPLNAFAMALFVGWFMDKKDVRNQFGKQDSWLYRIGAIYLPLVRFLIPLAILAIFLNGLGIL